MSIELPEASILAKQMNSTLRGKRIKSYCLHDCQNLQRIGFMNKDTRAFDQLINREVESVNSRGNTILVKLDGGIDFILNPEYGGEILLHTDQTAIPEKFHFRIDFCDNTVLTMRFTSMGGIHVLEDSNLMKSYVFKRDFNLAVASPIDEGFTQERFSKLLSGNNKALKSVLVGKDAVVVGLSNSAFQDIIYRARLHPKRKASELNVAERQALYDAIEFVLRERLRLNGKNQFMDLYGNSGGYTPAMGPNMKQHNCPACGIAIAKLSVGGGTVFFCPNCQV
jgi:formamidopyrimidine-DNA glycosylase